MKTIDIKDAEENFKKFDPQKICDDDKHDWAREMYLGTATGDYQCLICHLRENDAERDKRRNK